MRPSAFPICTSIWPTHITHLVIRASTHWIQVLSVHKKKKKRSDQSSIFVKKFMAEISNMEMMIIKLNIKMLETEPAIAAEI